MTALTADRALVALEQLGLDRGVEARRVGVPTAPDPEFGWRVPLDAVERLFERGVERAGPDFPLTARVVRAEDNRSPVTMYCRTRATGRDALDALRELMPLVTDGYGIDTRDGRLTWTGLRWPNVGWFDAADLVAAARTMVPSARRWVTEVTAPSPIPPGAEALFGCRCTPGPSLSVQLAPELLDARLAPADPAVRAHIEREIAALRAAAPSPSPSVVDALWRLGPTATLGDLAAALGTSERTVSRRLAELGTTFRAELDRVRASMARDAADRGPDAVAELLGYSDTRALRRARRRWGTPPG
ncbi:MAG: helix-turn-helix domain-containing protein [Myxococcota bacterium]